MYISIIIIIFVTSDLFADVKRCVLGINLRTGSSHHRRHSHDFTRGTLRRGRSQMGGLDDDGNFEVDQVWTSVKRAKFG